MDLLGVFGAFGLLSISVCLALMGILSQRLGRVTKAKSYYVGFYVAGLLVLVGFISRVINLGQSTEEQIQLTNQVSWVIVYNGAPALGITLGLVFAWRYWSWLLAERN